MYVCTCPHLYLRYCTYIHMLCTCPHLYLRHCTYIHMYVHVLCMYVHPHVCTCPHLYLEGSMQGAYLLEQDQTQPPGDGTVAAHGDQGTGLHPRDAVVHLPPFLSPRRGCCCCGRAGDLGRGVVSSSSSSSPCLPDPRLTPGGNGGRGTAGGRVDVAGGRGSCGGRGSGSSVLWAGHGPAFP